MKTLALLLRPAPFFAAPLLAACAGAPAAVEAPPPPGIPESVDRADIVHAAIGQTVWVNGPKVTPLTLVEDSRCPMNARCAWAGRVRITARIDLGSSSEVRELVMGQPVHVADGNLELVEVSPERVAGGQSQGHSFADYRFGFRFMGGY